MSGINSKSVALVTIVLAIAGLGYGIITPGPEGPIGLQGVQRIEGAREEEFGKMEKEAKM